MTEEIFELAKVLGHVSTEREEALRRLCTAAEEELRGRMREGIAPEDCEAAFCMGGAWIALAGLCAGAGAERVEEFSTGGLTIRQGGGAEFLERGAGLRKQAELVMAPYLDDQGFSFAGVRG